MARHWACCSGLCGNPAPLPCPLQALPPSMPLLNEWTVCQGSPTVTPDYFTTQPQARSYHWWRGVREELEGLVERCHTNTRPQAAITWAQYKTGTGLPAHPRHANLHTCCVVPPRAGSAFLRGLEHAFRLQPHGRHPEGHSRGYLKVPRRGWGANDREFYLHDLLCYMYRGPSTNPSLVVGHLCGNKLCVLPWHLNYISQSANVRQGVNKRKRHWNAPLPSL